MNGGIGTVRAPSVGVFATGQPTDRATLLWRLAAMAIFMLQAVLVLCQQHGLDEWQALEIALQSPTATALFENLRYEGHPPFWYWLLQAANHVVPADWVLRAVQLPIALGIQALILGRLPLPRVERLLVACSFAVLIDYGMMSRSLGMGVLLLLVAFTLREHKLGWVGLILLPMADFLFGCLSLVCLVILWREKRLWTPGVLLWLAVALFSAWSVRPAADVSPAFWPSGLANDMLIELARFGAVLLPLQLQGATPMWNGLPPVAIAVPAGLLFFGMGLRILWNERFATLAFAGFCALIMAFSLTVYPLATRHVSLAGLLLVLLVARAHERGIPTPSALFRVWLFVGAACGLFASAVVLARPFHAAPEAARYIESHGLMDKHWVTFPDSRAEAVSGLLGIEFERLEVNCTQSFVRWNVHSKIGTFKQFEAELQRIAQRSGSYYLLSDIQLHGRPLDHPRDYRLLGHIPPGYDGQNFYFYQVRPDLSARAERPPQCAPQRLPLRVLPPSPK
jgi:hypothetical protein